MDLRIYYRSDHLSDALSTLTLKTNYAAITDEIFDSETDVQLEKTDPQRRTEVVYKEKRLESLVVDCDFLCY